MAYLKKLGTLEENIIKKATVEELQQEYRVLDEILSIEGMENSLLIDYINDAETLIVGECMDRFMKTVYVKYPFAVIQGEEAVH
jgi:hypothetical protein